MDTSLRHVAAKPASSAAWLLPPALWASAAAVALLLAILAGRSDLGQQRAAMIVSSLKPGSHQQPTPAPFDAESATLRLAQAVRGLADDRDRLTVRLAAVEHHLDDLTGSIGRQADAAKAAGTEALAPVAPLAPWPDPPEAAAIATTMAPTTGAAIPWSPDAAAAVAPLAGYGADIGGALSLNALHTLWRGLRLAHPQLFQDLQAAVTIKDNIRSNRAELRLVVGPFANAEAAAQLCTALAAFRQSCQRTMFDDRLALQ